VKVYSGFGLLNRDGRGLFAQDLWLAFPICPWKRRVTTNVLQHLASYFSEQLASDDRAELSEVIDRYRRDRLPLIVPLTLIRHYVRKLNVEYLRDQIYLDPHPDVLNLLNQPDAKTRQSGLSVFRISGQGTCLKLPNRSLSR
jgi:hypothetical protein